jgi:hypothetical protein
MEISKVFSSIAVVLMSLSAIASSADSLVTMKYEIYKAQKERVALLSDSLWGHDTNRSSAGNYIETLEYNPQKDPSNSCTLEKSSPGFLSSSTDYESEAMPAQTCRPLEIAAKIKAGLGSCDAKSIKIKDIGVKHKYYGSEYFVLNEDCVCSLKFAYNEWSKLQDLLHPLNLLFNGPDYHRVTKEFSLTEKECLTLFDSEADKQVVQKAFQEVSSK